MPELFPAYLVFDIESVADPKLVSKVHFAGKIPPESAVAAYRTELMEKNGSDFIPYSFQIPISVAVAKVAKDFSLLDLVVLDEPEFRPHEICRKFWKGWFHYNHPCFVTFNGRGFDLPMMELAAYRYGLPLPDWFAVHSKSFDQPRSRYNSKFHLDLYDLLTNNGATRFTGGLNLASSLLGKPGKMGTKGDMVQDLYEAGKLAEINQYCRCDVLDTYFVFLRTMLLIGNLTLEEEQNLVKDAKIWITQNLEQSPAYTQYLDEWGDWENPWGEAEP